VSRTMNPQPIGIPPGGTRWRLFTGSLIWLRKKAGRGWHHHSRALHRRSMGQGGITGCQYDARAPGVVPRPRLFFSGPTLFFCTRLSDGRAQNFGAPACVVSLIAVGRAVDGGRNMPQISKGSFSKGIFGVVAVALTFGAAQLASGRDLSGGLQDTATTPVAGINRAAKADRAAVTAPEIKTRTIALRLEGLSDTSVLVRIPLAQADRNVSRPSVVKPLGWKLAVACEPVVSVLTDVAKRLEPGRCVT
jgi:hypothetical protein